MIWYKENTEQLYEILDTSDDGLSAVEAKKRLSEYGPNQAATRTEPLWQIIIEPFKSIFVIILGAAAIISIISGEALDSTIIAAIILINAGIFYTQKYATTRVLRSLKKHNIQQVSVIRNGETMHTSSTDLVPGDIIVMSEGERVAADVRIIHTDGVQIDESSLTGESVAVHKSASTLESTKEIYEQSNMAFQGSYVVSGTARAVVVETGGRTEFSRIADLASGDQSKSPVQVKIDQLITMIVKLTGIMAVIVFVLSSLRGIPADEALRFVISLTVSAVPEGLPVALTVIIVLGIRRMAKKKALVRSFKAIEDIGLITTIATDKTGTLTKNHLAVAESWSIEEDDVMKMAPKTLDESDSLTDPIDRAIDESVRTRIAKHSGDYLYSFDSALRMSGAYIAKDKSVYVKGSPEHMLEYATINAAKRHIAESVMHDFTSKGYRVIAIGRYHISERPPKTLAHITKKSIIFVGFLAFSDELRPEAKASVKAAHEAGISVRLITGDHFETAYNIAKKIGIATHPGEVIAGVDLPKDPLILAETIQQKSVFARILPEDKFRILEALKQTNITAMTGDGVNDVPALTNAHVGIAMGSGSTIARDAAGIVLLDNNFATIMKAVAEGRKIFDNIRRMLFYLLATSLGEIVTMLGALLIGLPLPVTAIQILWMNLVTATALVIPLGLEPPEQGYMKRTPRHPKAPLLSRVLLTRIGLVAVAMATVIMIVVAVLVAQGQSLAYIQSVAFMALIAGEWANAFNARGEYKSSFSRLRTNNPGLLIGLVIAITLQMLVMFGPLASVFGIVSVPIETLLLASGGMIFAVILVSEVHKLILRVTHRVTMSK